MHICMCICESHHTYAQNTILNILASARQQNRMCVYVCIPSLAKQKKISFHPSGQYQSGSSTYLVDNWAKTTEQK